MGTTNRRLSVTVTGSETGSFNAMMNRVNAGANQIGRGFQNANKEGSLLNKQFIAMKTTAKYALSGMVVFGIRNALNNLADFQTQLGEINALASRTDSTGTLKGLGGQLEDVGTSALLMSNKFGIAVTEVETYMQRFYTAFKPQGTPAQQTAQMEAFVKAHLSLVTVLGSRAGDPNALAGGLAAMVRIMPGGEKHPGTSAETLSNYFAKLVTSTPSLNGQDIASAAGRLASAKNLSGMTPVQLLSAFGLAAQTGGSAAVITRGMTQLLGQSLLHPTKPVSKATYMAAGLPTDPNQLAALGGEKVLESLISYVQKGNKGKGKPNLNLDAVYNAFSRQESVRQFVNMIANGGVPALKKFQKSLEEAAKTNYSQNAANVRLHNSILMRATVARQNLGVGIGRGLTGPLNLIGEAEIGVSDLVVGHPKGTRDVGASLASLAALNKLRKLGAFSKLGVGGKFGKFLGGVSSAETAAAGGAVTAEELSPGGSVLTGVGADGSRANPLWVIISPFSWALGGPSGMGVSGGAGGGGLEKTAVKDAEKVAGGGGLGALIKKVGIKVAGKGLVAGALYEGITHLPPIQHLQSNKTKWYNKPVTTDLSNWFGGSMNGVSVDALSAVNKNHLFDRLGFNKQQGTSVLQAMSHLGGPSANTVKHIVEVAGEAKGTFKVELVDVHGNVIKTIEEKGVPVKLWTASSQFPTAQGKAGSRKGHG